MTGLYNATVQLHYVMDPMCSWCWAFSAPFAALCERLDERVAVRYVMGGLAPDNEAPMPDALREAISGTWRAIEQRTGTAFNHDFWRGNTPRRSTYPACRAVIAAGTLAADGRPRMARAVQHAYYLEARNPSLDEVLVETAVSAGFDRAAFAGALGSEAVRTAFDADLAFTRRLGVQGFPSLVAEHRDRQGRARFIQVAAGYCDAPTLAARWQHVADALAEERHAG